MALNNHNRKKFVTGMNRRIAQLRAQTELSLDFAIETMFQERMESYLRVEEGLLEVDRMLVLVEADIEDICEVNAAQRLEARLEFIEDRFDEFESEIRQRPRRRRNKINLFNFFKTATGGGGDPMAPAGDVRSAIQAFEILDIEFGSSLPAVTRAFRERAKKLHPDSRQGDRSSEPELRKIIEAYQYLKNEYFGTGGEESRQGPY